MAEYLDLEQVFDNAVAARLREVWTTLPCRVTGVSALGDTVDVQPLPNDIQNGEQVALPSLTLRVCFPFGMKLPVAVGDLGLAQFSCRPIGSLVQSGPSAVELQDTRTHSLSDGFFLPVTALTAPPVTVPVARDGDDVTLASAWILWFNAIGSALAITPPSSPAIATIIATSNVEAT